MKSVGTWGLIIVITTIIGGMYAAMQFGEKSPIYASGKLILPDSLTNDAIGIRTVYVTIFDSESQRPMPFGAVRLRIDQDAVGTFMNYNITKEKLQQMNPRAAAPKFMRIKARLDIDGMGGRDQPGDIFGQINQVAFGSTGMDITLDQKVAP